MQYAIKDTHWPSEDQLTRVGRCGNMLRPNQVFNPDCFSLDNLEVVFDCQQETGEDGPYAALGYWYAKDRYAGTTPLEGWEEYGKSIETLLSLRCLEHEGSYYFFIFNPPLEEN